ncbi:hypothetical protein LM599_00695 [Candidatus Acetothermia bacterium]|jgi:processive 1,2-diacylglycerol beta-glucosyltransferase|nr:hypothetical protein [Candidatus Acetothermia bacterium]MCI2427318.1 hypothetical protein [Candidatus Acetothermia bacterium]MCI2428867.1 hypothetical protein [Candidatus Acetothermia bacterium]
MVRIRLLSEIDVLLLTACYGGGHIHAARELEAAFSICYPQLRVETMDFMAQMIGPWLDKRIQRTYISLVKYAPSLYRDFYHLTDNSSISPLWQRRINRLGFTYMGRYLRSNPPQVMVSLYPVPAGVVDELKGRGLHNIPSATVITDHVAHSQWVHPHTDLYLVPSPPVKEELIKRGIAQDRIEVTGIPINPAFGQQWNKRELQRKLGLKEDLFTVLVLGGAFGNWGGMRRICSRLATFPLPIQVVIVTGKDFNMKEKLGPIASKARCPMYIQGFVDDMPAWMGVADILISKAGGITVSEAMASALPLLIYRPIPGQEEANVRYLVEKGAAIATDDVTQLISELERIIRYPAELTKMRQRAKEIAHTDSARVAAKALYERFLTCKDD